MTRADWDALGHAIDGEVLLPGSPGYESARTPAIARFHDIRPQAVVLCTTPADVAETIAHARRSGLRTAIRSGGHCFAGRSTSEGIVLDVSPMRSVSVSDGVARIGAGTRLGDVYDALDEHGLTIAAGCGPAVGIAGLTLGGGLGILGRRHGLTSDQLIEAELVLADGRVVECDERHEEDLFWALRGAGGGNFGVVTRLAFRTLAAPDATAVRLIWPPAEAAAVAGAWQAWAPDAPEELAASLLMTAHGDAPASVTVFGAMAGSKSATAALLGELIARAGSDPASADLRHGSYRETKRHLAGTGGPEDDRGHLFSKSEFFARSLPAEAIAALIDGFEQERSPGQSRELDFTPWGGAYNRVRSDATAFVHRDQRFLLKHSLVVDPDVPGAVRHAARGWLAASWAIVHPWGSGGAYPNFPDPELEDPARAYYGSNRERLRRVKQRYDPDGFFRFHQSLP